MHILDNLKKIKNLDKSNVLGSIEQLSLQLKQTQADLKDLKIPLTYQNVNNIMVNGMGGSRLGGRVAQRLFEDKLTIPIYLSGNYFLPNFVNQNTLLILSSYSGNTEEIITSLEQAVTRQAKVLVFAQSGQLLEAAKKHNWPGYYGFTASHNPCNQPRMSIGYQILGIILLLAKCNLLTMPEMEIDKLINFLRNADTKYQAEVSFNRNLAKQTASFLHEKVVVMVGAEHVMGALHVWKNQTNENSKQLAVKFEIPELDHHLLEGMKFPKSNSDNLEFVFVQSQLYYPANQSRIEITKKVLNGYKIGYKEIVLTGKTKLEQVFEIIQFGSYVAFYLSILNNLDPTPIPWVDYFKKEIKKYQ